MWSLSTMATGFATGSYSLALARVGVGVGEAAFVAPAYSLLTDYFRPERRGSRLLPYWDLRPMPGKLPGRAVARFWRNSTGGAWRSGSWARRAFCSVLLLLIVKEPSRGVVINRANQIAFGAMVAELVRAKSYILMLFAFGLGSLSGVAFGYWGPELFARAYGVAAVVKARGVFAVYFGLSGLIGMLTFGALIDRMAKRGRAFPTVMSAIALFAATACILAATWAPSIAVAKLLAIPSGLLGGGWAMAFPATLQAMLPERYRASATALFVAATTLLGYLIGPALSGAISQALGNDAQSLRIGLSVTIPTGFLAALCALAASRHVVADSALLNRSTS